MLAPAGALADRLGSIATIRVGALTGTSPPIKAPRPFTLVGVSWAGPRSASIELRTRPASGAWSRWTLASALGHDPDGPVDRARLFGEPIWSGPATYVQLRSAGPAAGVRLHFVTGGLADTSARAVARLALAQPILEAGPGQPPIIARSVWAQGRARPGPGPFYGTIKLAFVHHSVTPNGYAAGDVPSILLSIFDYHRYVRGFYDIAYNFAVDAFGRIWETRAGGIDKPVIGAQAGGYNTESTGVVVLGDFMSVSPSSAAIAALERVLAWKLSLHGLPTEGRVTVVVDPRDAFYTPFAPGAHVSLPRVAGHRDGDSTDCPGNVLYGELPSMRPRIAALAGAPLRLTLTGAPVGAVAPVTVEVAGRLARLTGGAPLGEAQVELQRIVSGAAVTIATATTGADGSWSAEATLSYNTILRALHRAAPAAVSVLAQIAIAPAVTLAVAPGPPVQVSGTVAPAKAHVTIEVRRGRRVIKRRRVAVTQGRYSTAIAVARPGDVLRATTAADVLNAAGASAPATV